jgi:protocatechuate 4,5-dioxygenase beta chain
MIPQGIDLTICQEMLIDHGFIVPMSVMWSHLPEWPVKAVPFAVNTVLMPVPTAQRCFDVGKALGAAIESYPEDLKVVIFGTGGMSHQLSGERAGYINKEFDRNYMKKIVEAPEELCELTATEMIEQAGAEGIELIMWLVMRGALGEKVKTVHSSYVLPVSNTASGIMVMEQDES